MPYKTIRLAIVGVSHSNNDGTSRQARIRQLEVGDNLELAREPDNLYDPNAVMVRSEAGQIGYVARAHAEKLAPMLDAGAEFEVKVATVFAPKPGERYHAGVRMDVTWETE